jgi:hypothetical protein
MRALNAITSQRSRNLLVSTLIAQLKPRDTMRVRERDRQREKKSRSAREEVVVVLSPL